MLRLSKLADYGVVLMGKMAQSESGRHSARDLAESTKLPLPTVSKVLKKLSRAGLLMAQRGKSGGYVLARAATKITVREMIEALDGPIALTTCSSDAPVLCDIQHSCPTRENWFTINRTIRDALENLSLADLIKPTAEGASNPAGNKELRLIH